MPTDFPLDAFNDYLTHRLSYGSRRMYVCYLRKLIRELDRTGKLDESLTLNDVADAIKELPETAQSMARTAYRTWVSWLVEENADSLKNGGPGVWVPPELPAAAGSARTSTRFSDRAAVAAYVIWMKSRVYRRLSIAHLSSLIWKEVALDPGGVIAHHPSGIYRWDTDALPAWRAMRLESTEEEGPVVYTTEDAVRLLVRRGERLATVKRRHLDLVNPKYEAAQVVEEAAVAFVPKPVHKKDLDASNPEVALLRGFKCSECGRPVWSTPAGEVCRAGHKGDFEPGTPTEPDVP